MSSKATDDRNAQGFKTLRTRYVRRARYLASSADFHRQLFDERQRWQELEPNYPLGELASSLDELGKAFGVYDVALPLRLRAALQDDRHDKPAALNAYSTWLTVVEDVARRCFPDIDFYGAPQTAMPFISVALQMHSWALPGELSRTFWEIPYRLEALPYKPNHFEMWFAEYLRGYADTLGRHLKQIVDSDLTLEAIFNEAAANGEAFALARYPHGRFGDVGNPDSWWHYLPLLPGISTTDVISAAPEIVALSKRLFGARPLAARVQDLHREGLKRQEIADRLGIIPKHVTELLADPVDES